MVPLAGLNRALPRLRSALQRRLVSTSNKKNSETVTADVCKAPGAAKKEPKNWISYGYDVRDQTQDLYAHHSIMFVTVSLCLVVGGESTWF